MGEGTHCLHDMFKLGYIGALTREVGYKGVEFYVWRNTLTKNKRGRYAGKYKTLGARTKLPSREQILLAMNLAKQYNVQRLRL